MPSVGTISVDFVADISRFNREIKDLKSRLKDVERDAERSSKAFSSKFAKRALTAGAALFSAGGIIAGMREIHRLAGRASQVEDMQRSFLNLGKSAGFTEQSIAKLSNAVDGTVTQFELMEQANNALLLGIADNDEQMASLFDTAQRLARAVGKDAAFGVESLVTGIGRQSRLMLDNLGIVVKSEEAYEAYAQQIGVATSALTKEQKQTAFTNAALTAANEKVAALGEEQLTLRDKTNQTRVAIDNAGRALGDLFAPAVENTANVVTKAANALTTYLEKLKEINEASETQAAVQAGGIFVAPGAVVQNRPQQADIDLSALRNRRNETQATTEATKQQQLAIERLAQSYQVALDSGVRGFTAEINQQKIQMQAVTKVASTIQGQYGFLGDTQQRLLGVTQRYGDALAQAAIEGQNMGQAVVSAIQSIAATMAANAAIFGLLNIFTGGTFGATHGFLNFITGSFVSAQGGANFRAKQDGILNYHRGEDVQVTPKGQSGGGRTTIYLDRQVIYDGYNRQQDEEIFLS